LGDADHLWGTCSDILRERVTDGVWKSTFQGIRPVSADEERLTVSAPSGTVADRIQARYRPLIEETVLTVHGDRLAIVVEVDTSSPTDRDQLVTQAAPPDDLDAAAAAEAVSSAAAETGPSSPTVLTNSVAGGTDALYTFDDFVIGPSNRFAYAASMAVAETPGRAYNPLFIYGDAGLGKTHLLQSIRAFIAQNYPGKVVRYVSTERFLNDFIEAIRLKTQPDF